MTNPRLPLIEALGGPVGATSALTLAAGSPAAFALGKPAVGVFLVVFVILPLVVVAANGGVGRRRDTLVEALELHNAGAVLLLLALLLGTAGTFWMYGWHNPVGSALGDEPHRLAGALLDPARFVLACPLSTATSGTNPDGNARRVNVLIRPTHPTKLPDHPRRPIQQLKPRLIVGLRHAHQGAQAAGVALPGAHQGVGHAGAPQPRPSLHPRALALRGAGPRLHRDRRNPPSAPTAKRATPPPATAAYC